MSRKPLTLNRETLRVLSAADLDDAVGGAGRRPGYRTWTGSVGLEPSVACIARKTLLC